MAFRSLRNIVLSCACMHTHVYLYMYEIYACRYTYMWCVHIYTWHTHTHTHKGTEEWATGLEIQVLCQLSCGCVCIVKPEEKKTKRVCSNEQVTVWEAGTLHYWDLLRNHVHGGSESSIFHCRVHHWLRCVPGVLTMSAFVEFFAIDWASGNAQQWTWDGAVVEQRKCSSHCKGTQQWGEGQGLSVYYAMLEMIRDHAVKSHCSLIILSSMMHKWNSFQKDL
jgi:hypothetical protein